MISRGSDEDSRTETLAPRRSTSERALPWVMALVLAPFYRLFPTPLTLLVGQAALTMAVLMRLFNAGGDNSRISVLAERSATDGSLVHRIHDLPFDVATSEPKAMTVLLLLA